MSEGRGGDERVTVMEVVMSERVRVRVRKK